MLSWQLIVFKPVLLFDGFQVSCLLQKCPQLFIQVVTAKLGSHSPQVCRASHKDIKPFKSLWYCKMVINRLVSWVSTLSMTWFGFKTQECDVHIIIYWILLWIKHFNWCLEWVSTGPLIKSYSFLKKNAS